jgi:hypothetical protein
MFFCFSQLCRRERRVLIGAGRRPVRSTPTMRAAMSNDKIDALLRKLGSPPVNDSGRKALADWREASPAERRDLLAWMTALRVIKMIRAKSRERP